MQNARSAIGFVSAFAGAILGFLGMYQNNYIIVVGGIVLLLIGYFLITRR